MPRICLRQDWLHLAPSDQNGALLLLPCAFHNIIVLREQSAAAIPARETVADT
jgi:hypothetical protein